MNRIRYIGKDWDSTPAAIALATGLSYVPHAAVLTGRPFSFRNEGDSCRGWLVSTVRAWDGVVSALSLLCSNVHIATGPVEELIATLNDWVPRGPVVIGPVETWLFASRPDRAFHSGAEHFVAVIGRLTDQQWAIHDPEGCPYFLVGAEELAGMFVSRRPAGAVQVIPDPQGPPLHSALKEAWTRGVEGRLAAGTDAAALRAISVILDKRPLTGSESSALRVALPAASLSKWQLAEAAEAISYVHIAGRLRMLASSYARCSWAVGARNDVALRALLRQAAEIEEGLDRDTWADNGEGT